MSDEVVSESVNAPGESGPTGDRPRRSRKRGKRNRTRSAESSPAAPNGVAASVEPERPAPAPQRDRSPRRSGGHRHGQHGFGDGFDRSVCVAGLRRFPGEWPVNNRRGLAVAPLVEIARRGNEILLCDRLHAGDCVWGDGVVVPVANTPAASAPAPAPASIAATPTGAPLTGGDADAGTGAGF